MANSVKVGTCKPHWLLHYISCDQVVPMNCLVLCGFHQPVVVTDGELPVLLALMDVRICQSSEGSMQGSRENVGLG